MSRAGAWLAPALCVLGSSAVGYAVWRGTEGALLAAAGGFGAAIGFAILMTSWWTRAHPALGRPLDFSHVLDLLRRAYGGRAGWAVGLRSGTVEILAARSGDVAGSERERGGAIVELASVDGREHVVRDPGGIYVAIGDFPYGAGLLLPGGEAADAAPPVAALLDDLRRLVAGMRAAEAHTPDGQSQLVARQLALGAAGAQTLEGIARAGAELAQQLAQRGAVVVLRDDEAGAVLAVSSAADKRLAGVRLSPEAPVARALQTGVPVVTYGADDVFGPG
ncbi:MAG: hypothetical protein ACREME_01115, partial [Gemmatimonadales bacterium]